MAYNTSNNMRRPHRQTSPPYSSQNSVKNTASVSLMVLCFFATLFIFNTTVGLRPLVRDTDTATQHRLRQTISVNPNLLISGDQNSTTIDAQKASSKFILGPKITNWDQQRLSYQQPDSPKILLVSGSSPSSCETPQGSLLILKALKNKIDYTRIHNIPLFYNMGYFVDELAGYWSKLPLLRELMLAHPDTEWFWWMDSDAYFTDMTFELPMEKYKDYNIVLPGWDELVYVRKSWIGLNTGSFLIRNCQWSLDLLDAWAPMGPKGEVREAAGRVVASFLSDRPVFEADDQSALVYLLIKERDKWGDKVYMEGSFCLHGYWVQIVDNFDEMLANDPLKKHYGCGSEKGEKFPFVTHFVGCKPCGGQSSYEVSKCLSDMDRSFNFGDNQILQNYGFQHVHLGTPTLKRIKE